MSQNKNQDINWPIVGIEHEADIIFLTVGKYKLFFAEKNSGGQDAMLLYLHLMFTARIQGTSSVKANDTYLKKGLSWGEKRLKRAKAFLSKAKLIEYKQTRKSSGVFEEKYIIVKISNKLPSGLQTAPPDHRPTGHNKQMLTKKGKYYNKKGKAEKSYQEQLQELYGGE